MACLGCFRHCGKSGPFRIGICVDSDISVVGLVVHVLVPPVSFVSVVLVGGSYLFVSHPPLGSQRGGNFERVS